MANESKQNCTICEKLGVKPLTKENIYNYYVPLAGALSYGGLAIDVMNPNLVPNLLPKKTLTNVLMLSTIIGTSTYIYWRPHLQKISNSTRCSYAIIGGGLFSMGSILGWAILKSYLPHDNSLIATIAGLGTGVAIVKVCTDYFNDCDKALTSK